jgi:predicted chitinase
VGRVEIQNNPDIVASEIEHTIESACWYWRKGSNWGDINCIAEKGDFLKVTLAVNGGYNHALERNTLLLGLAPLFKLERCPKARCIALKRASGLKIVQSFKRNGTPVI